MTLSFTLTEIANYCKSDSAAENSPAYSTPPNLDGGTIGESHNYTCNLGYQPAGSIATICTPVNSTNGKWSIPTGKCINIV